MYVNRITPRVGAEHYQTYALRQLRDRKGRRAHCAEIDCQPYYLGWTTSVDESSELGQKQAHYIRRESGRSFTETRDGALTVFAFEAGQVCFAAVDERHWTHHEARYVVRGGDWRGNPRGQQARVHTRAADWVDDFATHQDKIQTVRERG